MWGSKQLPEAPGGGRHTQIRPTNSHLCGVALEKPPKWRTVTPNAFRDFTIVPACSRARRVNSL